MDAAELKRGMVASQDHIERMADRIHSLRMAQQEAEEQVFYRMQTLYRARQIDEEQLLDLMLLWAAQHCEDGWEMRWLDAGLPSEDELSDLFRETRRYHRNHPHGWAGEWLRPTLHTPMPRPGQCVVYVLYDDKNSPCYVGSTGNLQQRLKAHRKAGKEFVSWVAYPCEDRQAAYALEDKLLKEQMPYLNKRRGA